MDYKDYYHILGVSHDASTEEIKRAYRKLAMQCHPDHNQSNKEWANKKFKEVNEAFSILGDPEKRSQYDVFGSVENIGDIFSSQTTQTSFEELMNDFDDDYLGNDFLDNAIGYKFRRREFRFRTFRRGFDGSRKTRYETQTGIDLEDLFTQVESPEMSTVNYEIILSREQAFKGMEKELIRKGKRLKVNIPAGVKMGSKIKLRNALEKTDGQPGDIIISIKIK
jgi:curved DNA-binding protein